MSDYQAIYDAVRSRIHGGDVGQAVADVARNALDISPAVSCLVQDISASAAAVRDAAIAPSAVFRPRLSIDGNQWCALYGDNLQDGVAGFGDSPADAMRDFDRAWYTSSKRAALASTEGGA